MEPNKATCTHSSYSREVLGMAGWSGDYVCNSCGEVLTPEDVREIRQGNKSNQARKEEG